MEVFLRAVRSPALRPLVEHWCEVRGGRAMPAWSDIRPSAIRTLLPIVWVWKFDAAADRFTGRLAGERIDAAYGHSLRGAGLAEVFSGPDYPVMFGRFRRVVAEPALYHGEGLLHRRTERFYTGARVLLPLSGDGREGDGVIGACDLTLHFGDPPDSVCGEQEQWFALA
jgi:hypothetical protein